jgi:hypothetical protein
MKNTLFALFLVDVFIIFLTYFFGEEYWLVNSQVAFITSSFVMFGSMLSYRSMVQGRLNVGAIPDDERDTLDKLEDPYDIYDDEKVKNDENKTLVEVVKEERDNLKKSRRSLWQTTKDSKASLSFYRLGAYILLVFGFFYLNSNKFLDIPIYLISLAIPSIVIVIMLMQKK